MRPLAILAALFLTLTPFIATAERPYVSIEQRLSTEQMQATGLNQLSAQQLTLLNQLLREEHSAVAVESRSERRQTKEERDQPITSTLKGEFRGWQNGTVFELENGQRWRVTDSEFYTPKRLSKPQVTVKPGLLGSWYMHVEGVSVSIKVKRID